jgi:hypothetical protein
MSESRKDDPVDAEAARVGGITIRLGSVEVSERFVVVRMAAEPNEVTRRLTAEYDTAFAAWAAAGAHGRPPEFPEDDVYQRLRVALEDDVGTSYAIDQWAVGGAGTEWCADYRVRPPPPEAASALTLKVAGGETAPVAHAVSVAR